MNIVGSNTGDFTPTIYLFIYLFTRGPNGDSLPVFFKFSASPPWEFHSRLLKSSSRYCRLDL